MLINFIILKTFNALNILQFSIFLDAIKDRGEFPSELFKFGASNTPHNTLLSGVKAHSSGSLSSFQTLHDNSHFSNSNSSSNTNNSNNSNNSNNTHDTTNSKNSGNFTVKSSDVWNNGNGNSGRSLMKVRK